ncbi:MAG: hypothetical protein QXO27_04005 [Candidatus Aenigmatarchaeota archaeon]
MKGQMFLLAAIIIVTALFILRVSLRAPTIMEERKLLELTFEKNIFDNLQTELKKSARYSSNEKLSITTNVFDFGNFTREKMNEHALSFKFLFVGSLTNISTQILNVSLINLLKEPINATLNLNGSINTNIVIDGQRWDTYFSFTPGLTYVLTISYDNYDETVIIRTKSDKDIFVGFFDITLESFDSTYKSKFSETYA